MESSPSMNSNLLKNVNIYHKYGSRQKEPRYQRCFSAATVSFEKKSYIVTWHPETPICSGFPKVVNAKTFHDHTSTLHRKIVLFSYCFACKSTRLITEFELS
jgi:hypothetical protein